MSDKRLYLAHKCPWAGEINGWYQRIDNFTKISIKLFLDNVVHVCTLFIASHFANMMSHLSYITRATQSLNINIDVIKTRSRRKDMEAFRRCRTIR